MTRDEILRMVEDCVIEVSGNRIDELIESGRLKRNRLNWVPKRVIKELYQANRPDFEQLGYTHWCELAADVLPAFWKNQNEWNRTELPKTLQDTIEFFQEKEKQILMQEPKHQADLWRGLFSMFGPLLLGGRDHAFEQSESLTKLVPAMCRNLRMAKLADYSVEALLYQALAEVLTPVDNDGKPTKIADVLHGNYLRDMVRTEDKHRDVASYLRPNMPAASFDEMMHDGEAPNDAADRYRERVNHVREVAHQREIEVLDLLEEEYTQKQVAEKLGKSTSAIGERVEKIRRIDRENRDK